MVVSLPINHQMQIQTRTPTTENEKLQTGMNRTLVVFITGTIENKEQGRLQLISFSVLTETLKECIECTLKIKREEETKHMMDTNNNGCHNVRGREIMHNIKRR